MTKPTQPGPTWNPEQQMYDYPSGQPSAPPEHVFATQDGRGPWIHEAVPHVGQPYPGHPAPQKPRKIWPARHPVWTGLGILGVISLGIAAASGGGSPATPTVAASPTAGPAITATNPAGVDGEQETTPPPPVLSKAPAAKPKAWRTVATLGGSTNKRGAAFTLHGGQARLSYTAHDTSGIGSVLVAVYVMKQGTSLAADGGFPEVTVTEPGPGSTELANPAGRYYLDVSAANARWTVTVQELS